MYQRAGAFARAIELARSVQPELVTGLEEEWGDWYVMPVIIYAHVICSEFQNVYACVNN